MAGLIRQFLEGHSTLVPRCTLPVEGWCRAPGLGRLSLVWPWYAVEDPSPLADAHGRDVGVTPALEIHAPRAVRDVVLIAWAEPGGGAAAGPEWAASVARLHGARLEAGRPMALRGSTGRLARVGTAREVTWRLVFPQSTRTVHLEVTAPRAHADAYWVQVESMLATWEWGD